MRTLNSITSVSSMRAVAVMVPACRTRLASAMRRIWSSPRGAVMIGLAVILSGCSSAPMTRSGSLSSYDNLAPSDGVLTKSQIHIVRDSILAAKTVRIVSTGFSASASPALSPRQRMLVANVVDRSLCAGLSDRLAVVGPNEPADLTVRAVVTQAVDTNEFAAGASKVASIIPMALGSPVPVPRLPLGLGSLTLEAEALDGGGRQQAAMIWARGADSFTTSATVSKAGDAYELANSFGTDFSRLLVSGSTPFGTAPSVPSLEKLGAALGGKPKYAACEAFGRGPGVGGMSAGRVGLPPEWSDDGAPAPPTP